MSGDNVTFGGLSGHSDAHLWAESYFTWWNINMALIETIFAFIFDRLRMILLVLVFLASAVTGQQLPCGSTPIAQSRVIGGQDAKPGAWPWQIALKLNGRFICGGSLISADWIVTAAHCVTSNSNPASYKVVAGDHNRNTVEGTEEEVGVKRIISHAQYNKPSRNNNDIALVQLARPVKLSQRVNPVCLPSSDLDIPTGSKCYITGWGKIKHPGSSYHILQQAMMPPIDNAKCKQKISQAGVSVPFTPQMLCAGVDNTILSGCHGDSGGPYVCLNSDKKTYTLHGAVSWGSGTCNARLIFTVFARVTQFRAWIKQHTGIGGEEFTCSFDSDLCGFVQSQNDKFEWTVKSGGTPSLSTGPSKDVSGIGKYAYIETSSPRVQGDNARLVKSGLSFNTKKCLSFYYHMYGTTMGTLNVYVGQKKIFTKSGNQGNQWKKATVDITEPGASELIFEGIRGSSYTGDAAIDNVELKKCGGGEVTCSFDSDLCGFVQSQNDKFNWTVKSGGTPSLNTGPSKDVSGIGKYAYIETSSPRVQGDNARLVKSGLSFNTKKCLSFYYHMYGTTMGTLNVYVGQKKIFTKSGNQGNQWKKATVDITEPGASELIFEGIRGSSYTGDAAIDNVELKNCGGGAFGCNFDTSTCGFVQDSNDKFDWTRRMGSTPSSQTGPSTDHTTGKGYYMYIETSSPRQLGDNAKLNTPKLKFSGKMCLKFYYHMYGASTGTLKVIINGNNVFTASGNKGNKWLRAAVDVNLSGMYAVTFEGIRGSSFQGDIAIDDFLLAPGSCTSIPTAFGCNFDKSTCGFVQDSFDKFDWTRRMGSTPSSQTGPSTDHTTGKGYYMYIETSSPRQQGDNAKLNSPKLQFSGNMCLKFYYHMYGASMGTLKVIIKGNNVFTLSGNKGNKWLGAAVNVNLLGMYAVTFEGIRGSSFQGDIAIDDFLLSPGSCPSIPLTFGCNFDTSTCGFVQDRNDKFDWTRRKGSTPSSHTGPSTDHTTGKGYYMYIETSSPRQPGDNAKLNTPDLQFGGKMCLKFYYHMYGASTGKLNVIVNGNNVFTASGNKGNLWLKATVDVTLSGMYAVTFEGIRGSSYQGDIAIDDFLLVSGSCSSNP